MSDQSDKAGLSEERVRELLRYHSGAEKVLHSGSPFRKIHADSAALCDFWLSSRSPAVGSPSALHGEVVVPKGLFDAMYGAMEGVDTCYNGNPLRYRESEQHARDENFRVLELVDAFRALRHDSSDEGCKTCGGLRMVAASTGFNPYGTKPCPDCKGDSP